MMRKLLGFLFAGLLVSAVSAAEGVITLKSARSLKIEVETPSKRIGAPSAEEHFQARDQLIPAGKMLHDFLPKILPGEAEGETITLKVGTNALGAQYDLPKLEEEEFIITFPDAKTIVIAGGNQVSARNGVSEFLQRFCGMRWLFPGEEGLHLPAHDRLDIPMDTVRAGPHFHNRELSKPFPWNKRSDWNFSGWYGFNRGNWDVNFTHNLYQLFPWKIYSKTHPEFYPKNLSGNPADDHWNPVLNAPGLTEEAVKRICEQFRRSPEQRSYSLGINDIGHFEGEEPKGRNSVGYEDFSDYYYGWCNRVIEGVTRQYPGKYFGMIAYNSVTDPPSFKLDPHAVPFVCIERLRWYDPVSAEKDRIRTEAWADKATRLGWYDYIYGDIYYMIPRIYTQLMIQYLKFAAANGVTDYFGEANCSEQPTEGPKMWLILQLLWNPDADAEALLDEWYTLAVGKEAAPHLRRYFDHWEKYWREKVPGSEWFERYKNLVYFNFWDQSYMRDLTPEDVEFCRNEMQQVLDKANTPEQKRRTELFMKTWEQVKADIIYAMHFYHPVKDGTDVLIFCNDLNRRDCLRESEHPVQDSWMFWQTFSGKSVGTWEENGGCDESGALAVFLKTGSRWCFTRACKTSPDTVYRLRCQIQAENTGSDGQIYVAVHWRDKNNRQATRYILSEILGPDKRDGKWHTVEIQFSEPPIEKPVLNLHIGGRGVDRGVVRIDNVELSEIRP
ncbi:MAG: DUF4838 domain-containing protein [Lentisphaeria bacterium]|nr:DUF4838 domain-containing protein [Lentisphaeria bacterium]